jgi:PAS domain S-box-containing protein
MLYIIKWNFQRLICAALLTALTVTTAYAVTVEKKRPQTNPVPVFEVNCDRDFPPFEFVKNGLPAGFTVELIQALAKEANFNVHIVPGPGAEIRRNLGQGKTDLLLGLSENQARDFSTNLVLCHSLVFHDLFIPANSAFTTLKSLRNKRIGVQQGDIMHEYLLREGITRRIVTVRDARELLRKLSAPEIDAALMVRFQGLYLLRQLHISNIQAAGMILEPQRFAFAVPQGNRALLKRLNHGLTLLKYNGHFNAIYEKLFGLYYEHNVWKNSRLFLIILLILILLLLVSSIWTISLRNEVERQTQELRQIIDLVPHLIFVMDLKGQFIIANATVAKMFGKRVQDIMGKQPADLNPQVHAHVLFSPPDETTLKLGQAVSIPESNVVLPDGSIRILQIAKIPFRLATPKKKAVLTVAVDITDLKSAESALWESFRFNQEIISNAGEGIIVYDRSLHYVVWNRFMEKITGLPAEAVLGRQARELFPHLQEQGIVQLLERALRGETCRSGEVKFRVPSNNRSGWVSGTYVPHHNTAGEIIGVIGVIHDVSARKHLEAQLQQSQKMEAIGHLTGSIAHDFNNLLTPILGYADFSLMQLPPESKLRSQIQAIQDAAERAAALTKQLLAFSLKQVLNLNIVNLNTEIEGFRPMLKSLLGETIEINLSLDSKLEKIKADASQIHQILLNLAINARDAMPRGGKLTFKTSRSTITETQTNRQSGVPVGDYVQLSVTDTGTGMSAEIMSRIFEPFFTTKQPGHGTGLGLATVYGIVKQHGGFIFPASQPGQGTTFTLFFPPAPDVLISGKNSVEQNPLTESPPQGNETILLVEDEDSVRGLACEILTSHGYTVLAANNVSQALALCEQHGHMIRLLLTDVIMPGMNGKQLFALLKRKHPHLQVLYMSGYPEDIIVHEGILEENTRLLSKPFGVQSFLKIVHETLHSNLPEKPDVQTAQTEVTHENRS